MNLSKAHQLRNAGKLPKKKGRSKKAVTKALDDAWRDLVYLRAKNKCEYCGKRKGLNAHHLYSRSNYAVRWDVENGICVCVAHHVFGTLSFHKSPMEMTRWIVEYRGAEWHDRLTRKASEVMPKKFAVEKFSILLLKDESQALSK